MMLHIPQISEIKYRAEAIGLTLGQIANRAKVHPTSAYAAVRGNHDMRVSTIRRLTEALEAEERRVAEHLARLGVHAASAPQSNESNKETAA